VLSTFGTFTTDINPPNQECTAILRVPLFVNDSIILGGEAPAPDYPSLHDRRNPSSPYRLSLTATLASAFFAIFAKRLLSLYAFTGSRDSNIEQGRNPQRRLMCPFRVVLFTLSLLPRYALLPFSYAASVYVLKVNTEITTIILAVA
jgi:hypothetical protein